MELIGQIEPITDLNKEKNRNQGVLSEGSGVTVLNRITG